MSAYTPGEVCGPIQGEYLQYMVYLPKNYTKGSKHPAILFLHGGGGVSNPGNVKSISLPKMLIEDSVPGGEFNYIVVMPVAKLKGWDSDGQLAKVKTIFEQVVAETGADSDRLYCFGQSMGGNGAYEIAAEYPGYFAAIVPVCGYTNRKVAEVASALARTPMYAFHAANDALVPVRNTDSIVVAVAEAAGVPSKLTANGVEGTFVKYKRYATAPGLPGFGNKGDGHASYELAFKEPDLYNWLQQWRRGDSGNAVL